MGFSKTSFFIPIIVGIFFLGFAACFYFLIKRCCVYPDPQKNKVTSTVSVDTVQTIIFKPGDELILAVKPELKMESFTLPEGCASHPPDAPHESSKNETCSVTMLGENHLPPSCQVITDTTNHAA